MATKQAAGPPCPETNAKGLPCGRPIGKSGTCGVDHKRERMGSMRLVELPTHVKTLISKYAAIDPVTGESHSKPPRPARRGLIARLTGRGARAAASGGVGVAGTSASAVASPAGAAENLESS